MGDKRGKDSEIQVKAVNVIGILSWCNKSSWSFLSPNEVQQRNQKNDYQYYIDLASSAQKRSFRQYTYNFIKAISFRWPLSTFEGWAGITKT